jgi:Ca2+/H+ antiporter, TMEM165/GDT1 family
MLEAFTSSLLLITSQELGDKTFFIAMILAMRHPRRWVFLGAIVALAAMTVISVAAAQILRFLPNAATHGAFVILCFGFGGWLCWQASRMAQADEKEPLEEATEDVKSFESHQNQQAVQKNVPWVVFLEALSLTFVAEWGDRTQFATIALGVQQNPVGVILGGILGHAICALIAVLGGRWAAGHISERLVTWIGGLLFLLFGTIALVTGPTI